VASPKVHFEAALARFPRGVTQDRHFAKAGRCVMCYFDVMDILTLNHSDILPPGAAVRLTRATLTSERPKRLHTHDFHELFWVQNGTVRHHQPDTKTTLHEGDLIMMRPGQAHAVQGRGEAAMIVSLCLHPKMIADLAAQHPQCKGQFFWSNHAIPVQVHRDMRQLARLNQAAMLLENSAGDALAAQAFLLPLISDLAPLTATPDAPEWLRLACAAARDPNVFRDGASGLVALTDHSHPHVSRTMRRYLGQTPSEFINQMRMAHAARLLTTDEAPLPDIAEAIGIPNLSHFHKLFRAAHGMTPLQYRQQFQRHVVQPR